MDLKNSMIIVAHLGNGASISAVLSRCRLYPDTFEMKLGKYPITRKTRFHWFSRTKESGIC